jgi:hypothetical protein
MHTDPHGTASPPTTSSAPEMAMVPTSVGRASREWDEQHVDLRAASAQVAEASTAGFTPPVAHAATAFLEAWHTHTAAIALSCEVQADAMRAAITDWLDGDRESAARVWALLGFVEELR